MSLLAQRYAKAVFEVAEEQNAADAVDADLGRLSSALRNPDVAVAVMSPDTTSAVRASLIEKLLGDAHDLSKNLIGVVLRRRRQAILPDLSMAYKDLLRAARGKVVGVVETAKPIDEAGLRVLEARAAELTGKIVTLEVEVNPDLIGGVRLRLGNTLYDGSVATVLEDLERCLMEAPL
jgi:F-type H+-transporting ATPase subunit delta